MKFSNDEWRWISVSLREIYHGIFDGISDPEQIFVLSLVDAGEDVLAMEQMSAYLLAGGRLCPPEVLPTFKALAAKLGLLDNGFVRAVLQGRREMPPDSELPPI